MKKVLITGVAGLLGSRLAEHLISKGYFVIGVDDMSGGLEENIPKIPHMKANILDERVLSSLFELFKPDYVYHFAAYAAEGLSPFIRSYNYTNNLVATSKVVNECIKHDVKRLVFTSTMAVYGHGQGGLFDETHVPNPIDPYGVAKYACEMDIKIAGEQHGLDWCIIRPHNVYGVNQNIFDRYRNVLGIWMYQSLHKESLTIYGDGTQRRAFSFIDDCLDPLEKAATIPEASKQIINLGGTHSVSIGEAAKIMKGVVGNSNIVYLEKRHEVHTAIPTYQKSIDILGYKDTTELQIGLTKMWDWAKTLAPRPRFTWSEYEIEKGIYNFWKK